MLSSVVACVGETHHVTHNKDHTIVLTALLWSAVAHTTRDVCCTHTHTHAHHAYWERKLSTKGRTAQDFDLLKGNKAKTANLLRGESLYCEFFFEMR